MQTGAVSQRCVHVHLRCDPSFGSKVRIQGLAPNRRSKLWLRSVDLPSGRRLHMQGCGCTPRGGLLLLVIEKLACWCRRFCFCVEGVGPECGWHGAGVSHGECYIAALGASRVGVCCFNLPRKYSRKHIYVKRPIWCEFFPGGGLNLKSTSSQRRKA